jgi:hypothetical protein
MQPPRTRTPRIDLSNTETLRAVILNATAAVAALFVFRLATLFVADAGGGGIVRLAQMITEPIVWIFKLLPLIGGTIIGDATLIDFLIIPVIVFAGLLICGIMTGWRENSRDARRYPTIRD